MATQRTRRVRRVEGDGIGERASSVKTPINTRQQAMSPGVPIGANGLPMIEVIVQASETVPVAAYANVVVGPVAARAWVEDTGDLEDLRAAIKVRQSLVEEIVSEDRQLVQESVAHYNKQKAEEDKAAGKKANGKS